jgi:hypothetical protein
MVHNVELNLNIYSNLLNVQTVHTSKFILIILRVKNFTASKTYRNIHDMRKKMALVNTVILLLKTEGEILCKHNFYLLLFENYAIVNFVLNFLKKMSN